MAVEPRQEASPGQRRFHDRELAGVYRATLDGVILDCNEALARILGHASREELLRHGEALRFDGRAAALTRLRREGAVAGEEGCLHRTDGRQALVVYSERLGLDPDGREVVEGTVIDVTARRGAPAERLLTALAGGVAHRVTEPLSSVVANLGYAIETLSAAGPRGGLRDGETTLELDRALRDAKRGADAIRGVLRDLAVFARPAGAADGTADLHRALTSALSVVAAEGRGRARVVADLGESLVVRGSEPVLGRCLLQILLDALEAMAVGGHDHVLRVTARRAGAWAEVEVSDTGLRGDTGADHGPGLLGIGVVVSALRGRLAVEATPSGGRLVRVELPVA